MLITNYRNAEARKSTNWVDHTHRVIGTANDLQRNIDATEALYRNSSLTNADKQIKIRKANARIDTLKNELHQLVSDNPSQAALVDHSIVSLISFQQNKWSLPARSPGSTNVDLPEDLNQNPTLDSIFVSLTQFTEKEKELLNDRRASLKTVFIVNDFIRWTLLSIVGTACIIATITIVNQQKDNAKLINALENSNRDLEKRIKERTKDLELSNRDLTGSFDQIHSLNISIDNRNKQLEETLREVQLLYDYAPCGYHTVNNEGVIIRMNKTELTWLGYNEDEVVGILKVEDLLTKEAVLQRRERIKQFEFVANIDGIETEFRRKDGTLVPVLLNAIAYYDPDGNFLMNRSTVYDITHRKTLEDQLRQANQNLVLLNEEKDRYLGMATHDLKNPINNIYSIIGLLRHHSQINAQQAEYFELMEVVLKKMKDLVERLLDLNKIERSSSHIVEDRIDLEELLTALYQRFYLDAGKKDIDLIVEKNFSGKSFITDRMLLDQILDNLLSNAIKFSSFRKSVWIRVIEEGNDSLLFEVEDQGPGIDLEERTKLFKTFQRLSARPTGGETSTGLGLSIVKAITSQLGGDISIRSEVGKGSSFVLRLKGHTF